MDPSHRNEISRESPGSVMVRDVVVANAIENLAAGTALDLGCGDGSNTRMLARRGWQATGIDISPQAIASARRAAREEVVDARFIEADVLHWEPDGEYDLVIATYSLPGGADSHRFVRTAIRALKPGGTLILVEWDHSMEERWGLEHGDLPSPADLAAMVPGLTIEVAESRTVSDLFRDDPERAGKDATIAYLRARKPLPPSGETI